MSEDSAPRAQERFARDLSQIREDREVSLADLQNATQVPRSRLQSFEEGKLFDEQSRMNPVYLKAFVRAYAEAIGLPPDIVVNHVKAALSGDYQNELASQYLEDPASTANLPPTAENESAGEEPMGEDQGASLSPSGESDDPAAADGPGENNTDDVSSPDEEQEDTSQSVPDGDHDPVVPEAQGGSAEPVPSEPSPSTTRAEAAGGRWRPLALGATVVVVLALGVWGTTTYSLSSNTPFGSASQRDSNAALQGGSSASTVQTTGDTTEAADTAKVTEEAQSSTQHSSPVSLLRDTMYVTVRATSVVREMRVQQDDDLRRPYWLEQGTALVFPFTRRITIENQLDSLQVLLEGYPYPLPPTNDDGRIVVTRDTVERFADTLRSSPASLSVVPDTVQITNEPSPSSVSTSSDTTDGTS